MTADNSVVAIVQARMGSTRLPGKVMLPLGSGNALTHVVCRLERAEPIDEVVIATTEKKRDDIIAWYGSEIEVPIFRGSESNVLDRVYGAAQSFGANEVVRITADCPLIDPNVVSEVVHRRQETGADYAANIIDRTFPRGLDVEVFTAESFREVHENAKTAQQREHVTTYYRDHSDEFKLVNAQSSDVFTEEKLQDRADLRLTLDESDDYRLLHDIFETLEYDRTPDFRDIVEYLDETGISTLNQAVKQKNPHDASDS